MKRHVRIFATFEQPPVPNFDHWRAWDDALGADASPYGFGKTMREAVNSLIDQLEDTDK